MISEPFGPDGSDVSGDAAIDVDIDDDADDSDIDLDIDWHGAATPLQLISGTRDCARGAECTATDVVGTAEATNDVAMRGSRWPDGLLFV